ncbi:MAG: hypothetical protein PHF86_01205 [Candidatus Nanoarchaeia archaeon]|nr:hypothetical protein [Candidatus Nanoarchaeia archaeon]
MEKKIKNNDKIFYQKSDGSIWVAFNLKLNKVYTVKELIDLGYLKKDDKLSK